MRLVVFAALTLLAAAGCSSIKSKTTCANPAEVSSRQTYTWITGADPSEKSPGLERVRATVDRELAAKGYRRIDSGTPDLWMELLLGARANETFTGSNSTDMVSAAWWNWGTGMGTGFTAQTSEYKRYLDVGVGVLASLPGGRQELWRGVTKFRLSTEKPFDIVPVDDAVGKMIAGGFPKHVTK